MRESRTRRPSTPGAILKGLYLDPLDMTITGLAERLGVSRKTVSAIVNGRSPISVDMALRLSRAFSTTPELWLNMQRNVDLWDEQQAGGAWKNIVPVPMMDYAETPAGA